MQCLNLLNPQKDIDLNRLSESILKHKKSILIIFTLLALLSAVLMQLVGVNYTLSDYLPDDAPSTAALQVMEDNFDESLPNLSIYIEDVSISQALEFKTQLALQQGVNSVLWLDDVIDIYEPLETQDQDTIQTWYKDGSALFSVTVEENNLTETIAALQEFVGEKGILSGDALNQSIAQDSAAEEVPKIVLFIVPLVLLILLLSTSSWFEPVLFLLTIGVAVLLNEATNIFLGEISFITRSASGVLQLAVSMDYAVFLLHSFARHRQTEATIAQAMSKAMKESFSSIAASATTTVFGFIVLVLMRFKIGADMGIVLAKGILFSFICVMTLLPVLVISTSKLMDKTHHRPLMPKFEKFGKVIARICIPVAIIVMLFVIPGYLGQKNSNFLYGSSGMISPNSVEQQNKDKIDSIFGKSVQMVLLVADDDVVKEAQLSTSLENIEQVTSVVSYTNYVGKEIPADFLSSDQLSAFRSNGYSRLILYVDTTDEGDEAFAVVDTVRSTAQNYYPDSYYLVGQSVVNYDLMNTIVSDNKVVRLAVVLSIGMVLLLTFRSLSIPLILLLVIEGATWINLSVPYFTGSSLNYIGYQIVSSVQLGATVDYGILFVSKYMANRQLLDKRNAIYETITSTTASIITPASILTIAGLMLGFISSNEIISQLGIILGRGAVLSSIMVLTVLPGLLFIFDNVVQKTTLKKRKKENLLT